MYIEYIVKSYTNISIDIIIVWQFFDVTRPKTRMDFLKDTATVGTGFFVLLILTRRQALRFRTFSTYG